MLHKTEKLSGEKASQGFGLLRAQKGFSLIEVLVSAVVMAGLILTIYIGVVYADRLTRQNYRNRAATLLISGELEKQYVIFMKLAVFRPYTGRTVVIDQLDKGELKANMSIRIGRDREFYVTQQYPLTYVIGEITWKDPETKKDHLIRVREDFYDVEGRVNQP